MHVAIGPTEHVESIVRVGIQHTLTFCCSVLLIVHVCTSNDVQLWCLLPFTSKDVLKPSVLAGPSSVPSSHPQHQLPTE